MNAGITVKPLQWEAEEENWQTASTPFGYGYEVRKTDRGTIRLRIGLAGPFKDFPGSFDEAKAAAQEDFAARIASVLIVGASS